jgi:hypothetical protein
MGQRLLASLNVLRSQGMTDAESELVTRLTVAVAMVESSYMEAGRIWLQGPEHPQLDSG